MLLCDEVWGQSVFQFIVKVLSGVDVEALCRTFLSPSTPTLANHVFMEFALGHCHAGALLGLLVPVILKLKTT